MLISPRTMTDARIVVGDQNIRLTLNYDENEVPERRYYVTLNGIRVRPGITDSGEVTRWWSDLLRDFMAARRRCFLKDPALLFTPSGR